LNTNATISLPIPRIGDGAFLPYAGMVVVLAMLFGGAARQGLWPDAIVQLAALPLLPWALFRLAPSTLGRAGQSALVLLCAVVAWPVMQLVPLPPTVWSLLPGRAEIAAAYAAAGMAAPWIPVSLDAAATWRALLSLLPAVAIFLATLALDQRKRRVLIALILTTAFVSVLLGLLQTMGGPESPLRFYAITNRERAVGFFANANHDAAFLCATIPFIAAWAIGLVLDRRDGRTVGLILLVLLLIVVVIGVALTRSRAGIALMLIAGLGALLLAWRDSRGRSSRRLVQIAIGGNAVAVLLAFQFGFLALMQRAEESAVIEDIRWPVAAVTGQAAIANMPFGTGFGTFVPVFERFAPRSLVMERYVNHAHNDWLELWMTGGVPAMLLLLGFLVWFAVAGARPWRAAAPDAPVFDRALARAATIVITLALVHSAFDYPLRTAAFSVVFAVATAYLARPWLGGQGRGLAPDQPARV
jgi:O-antigen ligase